MRRRALFVLVLTLGLLCGSFGAAWATGSAQASGYTYTSQQDCAWGQTWISSDGWGLNVTSLATLDFLGAGNVRCGNHQAVARAGNLAVKQDLMFMRDDGQWLFCNQGQWWANNFDHHEAWTSFTWSLYGRLPCPGSWYASHGWSATYLFGWHGLDRFNWTNGVRA